MAIEKTVFPTGTAANKTAVLAWLQENATDYFDSIAADEDGNITCAVGGATFVLSYTGKWNCTTAKGATAQAYENGGYAVTAYKTDNGIALITNYSYWLIVTKSNLGTTSVAYIVKHAQNGVSIFVADLINNSSWYQPAGNANNITMTNLISNLAKSASLTALVPTPLGNAGTYAPDLFTTPYTQYTNNGGLVDNIIEVDGTKYLYNYVFALKE